MRRPLLLLALVLAPVAALAQQDRFADVEMKATHVRGNIYMLEGSGGNIGVSVGDDGILIVDDQFAPLADKIRAALAKLGKGKLRFILNTHWHGDHTGGNGEFGPAVPIIAHDNVRRRMQDGQNLLGRKVDPAPHEALPVLTFADRVSIHFNGEEIRAVHFPHGHTDGDSVIFFSGSNVVHMGDDMFAGSFPFVDLSSGGSVQGLERNVAGIMEKLPPDVQVIPGHGPLSTLDDLRAFHTMLVETIGIVRDRLDQEKSLEEIQKEGLPGRWAKWGNGFINTERWLQTIYESLSGTGD